MNNVPDNRADKMFVFKLCNNIEIGGIRRYDDLLYDEKLIEQGRNFANKIWNAFRLVKGWSVDSSIPVPEENSLAATWFQSKM